jgi:transcriptional regulator with XRE-family HTH domain
MTLTVEKVREIQNLRKAGYTLKNIAERCGVSVKTAWKYSQDIIPDWDYLELKLKDMRDTMTEMRGLITLMIAERERCWKACSDLTRAMYGCKDAIKSLQDAKDKATSEMKQQGDAIVKKVYADLDKILAGVKKIESFLDASMTVKADIERASQDIRRFEDGLRGMITDLTAFQRTIKDERMATIIGGFIDIVFRGVERMLPPKKGRFEIGGIEGSRKVM